MAVAVVTGAARGIGRAIAERLIADGLTVWALDTDADELGRTAEEIGAHAAVVDVTDDVGVAAFASRLGECDVLVNNAGTWRFTRLADTPIDEARLVLDVNLLGPLRLMQQLGPALTRSPGAAIVNISSITAAHAPSGTGLYPPSKAALEALTRMAAVEFGPRGIRCNAVGPGIIPTAGTLAHYGDEATRARRGATLPAGRFGRVEEIADVVSFLCSDAARYVTGQVIYVDGGYGASGADFFRLARDARREERA